MRARANPRIWLLRHLQVAVSSLGRLFHNPLSTLLTCGVIAIAVALPTGLYTGVQTVRALAGTLEGGASLSLFLEPDTPAEAAEKLLQRLRSRPDVLGVRLISRDEALAEFKSLSGFGQALDLLEENPLPPVLLVSPREDGVDRAVAEALAAELQALPHVELVQVDLQWVERLQAITRLARHAILLLAVLLGLAVLLIVGNTVRLEIQHRLVEIEINKQVGATDAFVRRPFLYAGLWYGLLGAILALSLLYSAGVWLAEPLSRLAGLYDNTLISLYFTWDPVLFVLIGSPLLGVCGAWLAVGRHLGAIDPD